MQYESKFRRARRAQRIAMGLEDGEQSGEKKQEEPAKLGKGDLFAMLLSSFYTLFLPAAGVLLLFVLLIFLIFGLF